MNHSAFVRNCSESKQLSIKKFATVFPRESLFPYESLFRANLCAADSFNSQRHRSLSGSKSAALYHSPSVGTHPFTSGRRWIWPPAFIVVPLESVGTRFRITVPLSVVHPLGKATGLFIANGMHRKAGKLGVDGQENLPRTPPRLI